MLSESEKQILLNVARTSIEAAVRPATAGGQLPESDVAEYPSSLTTKSGAFVTLRIDNELRGCIGYIEAQKPLVETVQEVAMKSALEDPRFLPVAPEELPTIDIEISVISPMKQIQSIDEIEVGKHGLMLELGNFRGLLLPQVATEYSWDRETFLNQVARKAGLPPQSWKDSRAKISIFSAEIFSEHSLSVEHK